MPLLPRLFIASSGRASRLANELASALSATGEVNAESWARPQSPENSRNLLATLLERAATYDLAIVILTGDDVVTLKDGETEVKVPRDNCIFELGLFIGAFGQAERCYLLSSVEPRVLFDQLSDLGGQLYRKLTLSDGLDNVDRCRVTAQRHLDEILAWVRSLRRYSERPRLAGLRIDDILEREVDTALVRDDDVVLVKESRPVETRLEYARVVMRNMARPVNYLYLFGSGSQSYPKIVDMLRSMVAVEVLDEKHHESYENATSSEKLVWLSDVGTKAEATLRTMRKHLFVELVDEVAFDEFCIHGAGQKHCRGYVRIDDRYVPVAQDAALMRYEHPAYKAIKLWPTKVIFDPENLGKRQRQGLERQIRDKFPEGLRELVISACFEPKDV